MKLNPGAVAKITQDIGRGRHPGFLIFGGDRGLGRESAVLIVTAIAGAVDDPFRVAVLEGSSTKNDPARLTDELNALSFTGGRRAIWVREAGDSLTADVTSALAMLESQDPETRNILLVEAGDLDYRSTLRKLFEGHPHAAAIACDGGEAQAGELIDREIAKAGLLITADARATLLERFANDRALLHLALEKLTLYMADAPTQPIDGDVLSACVEDPETAGMQEVIDALLDGDAPRLDKAFERALSGGLSAVGLLRAAARSLQRVDQVVRAARGGPIDAAIAGLRPPLPFSARASFAAQCRSWTPASLDEALSRLIAAESLCKTTGLPEDVIASRALLALASRRRASGRTR